MVDRIRRLSLGLRGLETPCQGCDSRGRLGCMVQLEGNGMGGMGVGCLVEHRATAVEQGEWMGTGLLPGHKAVGWALGGWVGTGQRTPTLEGTDRTCGSPTC